MEQLTIGVVSGLSVGAVYTLIGLGLVIAIRATGTFNFAHGELMVFPALIVGYLITGYAFNTSLAVLVALAVVLVLGALFYKFALERTTGMPHWMGLVATLGLASIMQGVMALWFGTNTYRFDLSFLGSGTTTLFGARVATTQLILAGISIAVSVALAAALRFTSLGTSIRAAGQDALLASQGGINIRYIFLGSWAGAAVLAGIAGILYASTTFASMEMYSVAWAAFPAVVLGGLDSIEGAIVGGLSIGLLQGLTTTYIGGDALELITYVLLLAVLMVRPQGIFGTKEVTRL